jgi:rod shape-determining protein MreC
MSNGSGKDSALFAENTGSTLALVAFLAIAITMMVTDHRGRYLRVFRESLLTLQKPLYQVAAMPGKVGATVRGYVVDRAGLAKQTDQLQNDLSKARAEVFQLRAENQLNAQLRSLLKVNQEQVWNAQAARVVQLDRDPFRQRILINKGTLNGVNQGQAVANADGVVGQVIWAGTQLAQVLLISDATHALPVIDTRSGLRGLILGMGRADRLAMDSLPLSADLAVGDLIVSSALGGRFPPGFPVGVVRNIERTVEGKFVRAELTPSATLDELDVLLVLSAPGGVVGETLPLP